MAILIAFVGAEATGKSTVLDRIDRWLRPDLRVVRVHAGKPPSTVLTFLPHALLPAFRALLPGQRTVPVQGSMLRAGGDRRFPLAFGVRAVMLAYERRAVLRRAARSGAGTVVLSDRYPSREPGGPDGPQLVVPGGRRSVRGAMARLERRLYAGVPMPDVVFHLRAPLDVTLARNASRNKREPEPYVRFRHELSERFVSEAPVHRIDTDRDVEAVVEEIQEVIGGRLRTAAR
jgi:thymidylate kinase